MSTYPPVFTSDPPTKNPAVLKWLEEMVRLTKPDQVVFCEHEKNELIELALLGGTLTAITRQPVPNAHNWSVSDVPCVARARPAFQPLAVDPESLMMIASPGGIPPDWGHRHSAAGAA